MAESREIDVVIQAKPGNGALTLYAALRDFLEYVGVPYEADASLDGSGGASMSAAADLGNLWVRLQYKQLSRDTE